MNTSKSPREVGALIIREARECLGVTLRWYKGKLQITHPDAAHVWHGYDLNYWRANKQNIAAALNAESEAQ